jgi:hypothetical protein
MILFLFNNRSARTLGLIVSVGLIAGCVGRKDDAKRASLVPRSIEARRALETSLSAWRDQDSPKPELVTIGGLNFVDLTRLSGQKLDRFQILTENETPHARYFTTKLELTNPDESKVARYLVFGRAPVWVYREEDFNLIMHWDHKMDDPAIAADSTPDRPADAKSRQGEPVDPNAARAVPINLKEQAHEHHKNQ